MIGNACYGRLGLRRFSLENWMPNPRIEPLKKVLAIDPNDEVAWFGLGKAYMEDNNWQEAVLSGLLCTGTVAAETRTF